MNESTRRVKETLWTHWSVCMRVYVTLHVTLAAREGGGQKEKETK